MKWTKIDNNLDLKNHHGTSLVKNPFANKGQGFDPWPGKIPHAVGAIKPTHCNYQNLHALVPMRYNKRSQCKLQLKSSCCLPQLKKGHTQQQRPSTAKNK